MLGSRLIVHFTLPALGPAQLELLDLAGRRVAAVDVGALGPGAHAVDLAGGLRLTPELYVVRLVQGARQRMRRVVVLE